MSFQAKTYLSILRSLIARMRSTTNAVTNFTPGSVARMYMEAPAQEIDQLYQQMLFGLLEAIPVAIYTAFNFPPLPPTPASGLIRITLKPQNTSIAIPRGTVFTPVSGSSGGVTYSATAGVTIKFGSAFADVAVAASASGIAGNIPAGTLFNVGLSIPGLSSISNIAPFVNGAPQESASGQKVRFQAYAQTLSRGTKASLIYALTRLVTITDSAGNVLERVATAGIVEPWLTTPSVPPGLVYAYVHNGVGLTSPELVLQAEAVLNGYTSATGEEIGGYVADGVDFHAFAAAEQALDISGMITPAPGLDAQVIATQAVSALYGYVQQLPVGQPYLPAVANDLVMAIKGVWNWMPLFPTDVFAPASNTKLMPGTFDVIAWLAAKTVVQTTPTAYLL